MSTTETNDDAIAVEMEVRGDRTILTIEGKRDAAVIVRSASGERIYLPPEDFEAEPAETTPYSTSPYSTTTESDESDDGETDASEGNVTTPYSKTADESVADDSQPSYGRAATPAGIRIVHPEPVSDVRFVR